MRILSTLAVLFLLTSASRQNSALQSTTNGEFSICSRTENTIEVNMMSPGSVSIYSLAGNKVKDVSLPQGKFTLDMSTLPRGTYLLNSGKRTTAFKR